jgi:hypothetical protein
MEAPVSRLPLISFTVPLMVPVCDKAINEHDKKKNNSKIARGLGKSRIITLN